jgi:hypothetical protein
MKTNSAFNTPLNECYCSKILDISTQRWRTNRVNDKELYQFAKYNPNIKEKTCHINAILVHNWLGANCKIYIGHATLVENGNERDVKNHLWNIYSASDHTEQLIDIENYLYKDIHYINHRGIKLNLYDYFAERLETFESLKT